MLVPADLPKSNHILSDPAPKSGGVDLPIEYAKGPQKVPYPLATLKCSHA